MSHPNVTNRLLNQVIIRQEQQTLTSLFRVLFLHPAIQLYQLRSLTGFLTLFMPQTPLIPRLLMSRMKRERVQIRVPRIMSQGVMMHLPRIHRVQQRLLCLVQVVL